MKRIILIAVFVMSLVGYIAPVQAMAVQRAHLQWLDKVTARIFDFELEIGQTQTIGVLSITLRHCDRTPPQEPPESTAFLEIREQKTNETEAALLFSGWMFASSPAVSSLEHPVYDVWVVECLAPL